MTLSDREIERFSRQIIVPEIGPRGQARLLSGHILVVGLDAALATMAISLAGAGIGTIGLCDDAAVQERDLAAPLVFTRPDLGRPRLDVGMAAIRRCNPATVLLSVTDPASAIATGSWDLVASGASSISPENAGGSSRTLLACNRAATVANIPLLLVGAAEAGGWIAGYCGPGPSVPCWECMRPDHLMTADCGKTAPASGPTAGIVGNIAAIEAAKLVLRIGESIAGQRTVYVTGLPTPQTDVLQKNPQCPVCRRQHPRTMSTTG
jgi:molybdopterin/thiamine biosynthesis adenylyltransferase